MDDEGEECGACAESEAAEEPVFGPKLGLAKGFEYPPLKKQKRGDSEEAGFDDYAGVLAVEDVAPFDAASEPRPEPEVEEDFLPHVDAFVGGLVDLETEVSSAEGYGDAAGFLEGVVDPFADVFGHEFARKDEYDGDGADEPPLAFEQAEGKKARQEGEV